MRIAMTLPVADRPASRAYALWTAAARDLAAAVTACGVEVTTVTGNDPFPGGPTFRHGLAGADDTLRLVQLFRRANDFELVHDLLGLAALQFATFVVTPVLATVWMDMWEAAGPIYHDLNQRVFYHAPGERDRSTALLYSATIPWALDPARVDLSSDADVSLAFAGDLGPNGGLNVAIDFARRVDRPLTILGSPSEPSFFSQQIVPRIDGESVRWIEAPASPEAVQAVRRAATLVHVGGCDGLQQLVLLDAALGGTPVIVVGDVDRPCWLRDGHTGAVCRTIDDAAQAFARVSEWNRVACREAVIAEHPFDKFVDSMIALYTRIAQQQRREDRRPWGYYEVLSDEPDHKVKRLVVFPGKRLSLQRHRRRDEHWYLVEGEAAVVQDEEEIRLLRGQSMEIPKGCWHRIRNPGSQNLTLIEVQTGDYFGEDDIERTEDDYGRK